MPFRPGNLETAAWRHFLGARRLTIAGCAIAAIACLDWYAGDSVTLGAFYILPVVLLGGAVSRKQIAGVAVLCAILRLAFNRPASLSELVLNGGFALSAYVLIGFFSMELGRKRRELSAQDEEIKRQHALRFQAEEQLHLLAESSPAAIFTLDENARIVSANRATRELLGLPPDTPLEGFNVERQLPVLADALKLETGPTGFRTASQVQGQTCTGVPFLALACFSTYKMPDGAPRLAAIAFDSTEDTREREEQSQQQLRESNRVIAGAVAHEVRNVCGAMAVVLANLGSVPGLRDHKEYQALEHLVKGLAGLARLELEGRPDVTGVSTDLRDLLNQLRILVEPAWEDEGGEIVWPRLSGQHLVSADSFALLQACLNIANNSLAAVAGAGDKVLTVEVSTLGAAAYLSFTDTGMGVAEPEKLFQPFRSGSGNVGLGLYLSRALLRRYGGDIRHEPRPAGARFVIEVSLHGVVNDAVAEDRRRQALIGR
jgi:two-component system, LuxR family, sensor kinase FixL